MGGARLKLAQRRQQRVVGDPAERQVRPAGDRAAMRRRQELPAGGDLFAGVGLFCGGTQRTALTIAMSDKSKAVVRPLRRSRPSASPSFSSVA